MVKCKDEVFIKKCPVVRFEDFESEEVTLPTPEEALEGIQSCETIPKLFSNIKAYLMQIKGGQGNQGQSYKPKAFVPQFTGVAVNNATGMYCREGSYLIMQGSFINLESSAEWRLLLPENLTIANDLTSVSTNGVVCGDFEILEYSTPTVIMPLARGGDNYIRFAMRNSTSNKIYGQGITSLRSFTFNIKVPIQEWI